MKLTSLVIKLQNPYRPAGTENRLRAVVKLESKESTVECVLSEQSMIKMLDLCADEIAEQALARVTEFTNSVTALDGEKFQVLPEV